MNYYYFIKLKLSSFLPTFIWNKVSSIKKIIAPTDWGQVKLKISDKQSVFVIRRKPPGGGLFSNLKHVLEGIIYAQEHNYIPFVDMKNYPTSYSSLRKFNDTYNAWEYFFEPISELTIESAYDSESVILSAGDRILSNYPTSGRNLQFIFDKTFLRNIHSTYEKSIKLNSFTLGFIQDLKNFIKIDVNNCLGVFYRGDKRYIESGHTKHPSLEMVVNDVKLFVDQYSISSIFLSTDSKSAREKFIKEFGTKLIRNFRIDFDKSDSEIIKFFDQYNIPTTEISISLSYLAEIYISAILPYNISAITNGSAFIHIINGGKFRASKIYNLGTF